MQLAKQTEDADQKMSPSFHAALIDSLFEAPGTVLVGIFFVAVAASLTALKTGDARLWTCVGLLMLAGAVRAFDLHRYQTRKSTLTAEQAVQCQKRYQFGAMVQAAVIGLWCSVTLFISDDAVVQIHDCHVAVMKVHRCGRALGPRIVPDVDAIGVDDLLDPRPLEG